MTEAELQSAFPPPPQHFRLFNDQDLDQLANDLANGLPITGHFKFLQPPPPPGYGSSYNVFGELWPIPEKLPSLKDMGIRQLYVEDQPQEGHAPGLQKIANMKGLSRELLLNYLELVGVMGINPEKFPEKIEHLRIIFINIHHLLNEYRPQQARETLILLMEDYLTARRTHLQKLRKACVETRETLEKLSHRQNPPSSPRDSFGGLEATCTDEPITQDDLSIWSQLENLDK